MQRIYGKGNKKVSFFLFKRVVFKTYLNIFVLFHYSYIYFSVCLQVAWTRRILVWLAMCFHSDPCFIPMFTKHFPLSPYLLPQPSSSNDKGGTMTVTFTWIPASWLVIVYIIRPQTECLPAQGHFILALLYTQRIYCISYLHSERKNKCRHFCVVRMYVYFLCLPFSF